MNDGVNFSRQQQDAQDAADFSQQAGDANREANQESNLQVGVEFEYCLDDILASANFEPDPRDAHAAASARATGGVSLAAANGNGDRNTNGNAHLRSWKLPVRCAMTRRLIGASGVAH
jgi:hypothetical protein